MFQLILQQPASWCSNWYSGSLTVDMPRSLTADVYWLFFNSFIQPKVSLAVDIVATLCLHVSGLFPSLTGSSHCTCTAEFTEVSSQSFCLGAVLDWASRTSDEVMSLCNSCAIPARNRIWPKSLHFLLGQSSGLSISYFGWGGWVYMTLVQYMCAVEFYLSHCIVILLSRSTGLSI